MHEKNESYENFNMSWLVRLVSHESADDSQTVTLQPTCVSTGLTKLPRCKPPSPHATTLYFMDALMEHNEDLKFKTARRWCGNRPDEALNKDLLERHFGRFFSAHFGNSPP